ncbi:MAG: hypothetical protein AAGF11_06525 [Myxococcota bacterium]
MTMTMTMSPIARSIPYLLLLISAILAGWGMLGLVEYFFPAAAFGLQDAGFPAGTQFIHFASILVTGVVFLGGYLLRWRHTPFATVTMYAVLATICFIETVDFGAFGGGPTRFIPMTIEYVTYVVFSAYLLRSAAMHDRFWPAERLS